MMGNASCSLIVTIAHQRVGAELLTMQRQRMQRIKNAKRERKKRKGSPIGYLVQI